MAAFKVMVADRVAFMETSPEQKSAGAVLPEQSRNGTI
jgi:hypothetical protein